METRAVADEIRNNFAFRRICLARTVDCRYAVGVARPVARYVAVRPRRRSGGEIARNGRPHAVPCLALDRVCAVLGGSPRQCDRRRRAACRRDVRHPLRNRRSVGLRPAVELQFRDIVVPAVVVGIVAEEIAVGRLRVKAWTFNPCSCTIPRDTADRLGEDGEVAVCIPFGAVRPGKHHPVGVGAREARINAHESEVCRFANIYADAGARRSSRYVGKIHGVDMSLRSLGAPIVLPHDIIERNHEAVGDSRPIVGRLRRPASTRTVVDEAHAGTELRHADFRIALQKTPADDRRRCVVRQGDVRPVYGVVRRDAIVGNDAGRRCRVRITGTCCARNFRPRAVWT